MFHSILIMNSARELELLADITACYKNNGGEGHFKCFGNLSFKKKKVFLKDEAIVSSHVPTLKHEVEQQLLTRKQLFQLLQETNTQLFPA